MSLIYTVSGTNCLNHINVDVKHDELADDPNENTNGVIAIQIKSYGDAPDVPFIKVWATNRETALRAYYAAHKLNISNIFSKETTTTQIPLEVENEGFDVFTDHIDYVNHARENHTANQE